jgi:L-aminopeptidase/D-esterase-like protein
VMVANSVGGIWDDERHEWTAPLTAWDPNRELLPGENTTIVVVATKEQADRVATVAHDGIARAVRPAHTMNDGDTIFCIATGTVVAPYDVIEVRAAEVVARGDRSGRAACWRSLTVGVCGALRSGSRRPDRTVHGVGVCRRAIRFRA